ncbi:MAG: indole-3-glycerol phosphate synthase TrpC [FCB group bacterium]|nr:indole-3-glycerol phosphate synthase TrpC [FCB group bacterium]
MNILQEIVLHKQAEVRECRARQSLEALKEMSRTVPLVPFGPALVRDGIQVIAELKRKSPSAGEIFAAADPETVAREYEQNGAAAISVLTDRKYFGGSLEFLRRIKTSVSVPVLRKDFIVSEYQVYESYVSGADAILLIAEALEERQLRNFYALARELGLEVLVEFHAREKVSLIQRLEPEIVGVNTRNLETMTTDIHWCEDVFEELPPKAVKVAESGVHTSADLIYVEELGYDAALVGTTLMKYGTPGDTLKRLRAGELE